MHTPLANTIFSIVAFVIASLGAVCDVRTRRIPNWLTGSGIGFGLLLHFFLRGWQSMLCALGGAVLAGTVFLVFHLAGGMGAGDVKLIAAVCCLAGLERTAGILIGTALMGGLFGLLLALFRRRLRATFTNLGRLLCHHAARGLHPHSELNLNNVHTLRLPYGLAIAAGAGSSLCGVLLR